MEGHLHSSKCSEYWNFDILKQDKYGLQTVPVSKLGKYGASSRLEGCHLNPTNDQRMWNHGSQED